MSSTPIKVESALSIMKKESYTIQDRIDVIVELDEKLLSINDSIIGKGWDSLTDSRMLFVKFISEMNSNTIFQLSFQAESHEKLKEKEWLKARLPHFSEKIDSLENLDSYSANRHNNISARVFDTLILDFFNEFETRLRSIVRNLENVKHPKKKDGSFLQGNEPFYFICKGLFDDYLGLKEEDYEVINVFSTIRNTIHNTGIYFAINQKDKSLDYKGKVYTFEYGKPVNFLNSDFKKDILMELLELFSKVVLSKKINDIKLIKDPLANVVFE